MQIDYQPFCSTEPGKLTTPTTYGDKTFASDGRIIIEIPALENPEFRDKQNAIPEDSYLNVMAESEANKSSEYKTPSEIIGACVPVTCDCCKGTKKTNFSECDECVGEGVVECKYGLEHDCPRCEKRGYIIGVGELKECPKCDGLGYDLNSFVWLGNAKLSYRRTKLIEALPDAQVWIPKNMHLPIAFTFTGGRGVVMPMR